MCNRSSHCEKSLPLSRHDGRTSCSLVGHPWSGALSTAVYAEVAERRSYRPHPAVVQAATPEHVPIVFNNRSLARRLSSSRLLCAPRCRATTRKNLITMTACPALSVFRQPTRRISGQPSTKSDIYEKGGLVQLLPKNSFVERHQETFPRRGRVSCWRAWPRSGPTRHPRLPRSLR